MTLIFFADSGRTGSQQYNIQEAWHSFIDAKCKWHSNQLDGAVSKE